MNNVFLFRNNNLLIQKYPIVCVEAMFSLTEELKEG